MKSLALILLSATILLAQLNLDNDQDNERLKYGMSQSEWQQFKASGLTTLQLEDLISCGISFNEYTSRPWMSMGLSEKKWLDERCKGMADEDIQSFNDKGPGDLAVIVAFLLPGSYHWRTRHYGTAAGLSGVFAVSLGAYFLFPSETVNPPQFNSDGTSTGPVTVKEGRPIFLVAALADMVLSGVLSYRAFNKPAIPEGDKASEPQGSLHFNLNDNRPTVTYRLTF